jgi:hypothetical protein
MEKLKRTTRAVALRTADLSWAVLTLVATMLIAARALFDHRLVSRYIEFTVYVLTSVAAIARVIIAKQVNEEE